ncbi:GyrI-like domain-containing protein [Loigolactobacillus jiayinensis]|uniref:GyrI-like domain-containing protein n=1 Tax=Loigolactobacillus jiayinensis TaxID=2486016 RepID=A0ABW1RE70_9LACO|nr:GyrI-like domain-containing protein [Loigolactobacillus jiayinensis]
MTQTYKIQNFPELTITGYAAKLPLPTMDNLKEVSAQKSHHFMTIGQSGQFPTLMQASRDKIGYALSGATDDYLEYFAGANTTATPADTTTRTLPAGDYIVLKGQGGPSRQLFDQLISQFFGTILPADPHLYPKDSFVIEALLNGNPTDAVVELRIPVSH